MVRGTRFDILTMSPYADFKGDNMAKVINLQEHKDQILLARQYSELRETIAQLNMRLSEVGDYIERHELRHTKSNHKLKCELASLVTMELHTISERLLSLTESVKITKGTAEVIRIDFAKKKAA
jgi:hypothetical protein